MQKLKWKNLLIQKCPKDGMSLHYQKDSELFECALYNQEGKFFTCDFSISPRKLEEVQKKIKTGKFLQSFDHENDHFLNNL